jgi:hypothetical protein
MKVALLIPKWHKNYYKYTGQKAKALQHYEKFLDLWKDADPGMAEVEGNMMT